MQAFIFIMLPILVLVVLGIAIQARRRRTWVLVSGFSIIELIAIGSFVSNTDRSGFSITTTLLVLIPLLMALGILIQPGRWRAVALAFVFTVAWLFGLVFSTLPCGCGPPVSIYGSETTVALTSEAITPTATGLITSTQ